jgi:Arc/MetJ-type ribon-helix-helix transcriptional regulator
MMVRHTFEAPAMARTKVAITLDEAILRRVDGLVRAARYRNRSQAIEAALKAELRRLDRNRLAEECAKLDPAEERALSEEGLSADGAAWPAY